MHTFSTRNKSVRLWLSSLAILLAWVCSISFVSPAQAQQSKSLDELRALGAWSQEYSAIMNDLFLLFDTEQLNVILKSADNIEDQGLEKFDQAVKIWSENLDDNIKKLETRTARLPEAPRITFSKRLNKANQNSKQQIDIMVNKSIEAALHLKTAFKRIAKGDESGVTEILVAQQDAAILVIEAEIIMIKSALVAIPKSNPNYQFQSLLLADDRYALSEVELTKLSITDTSTLEARMPFILEMEKQINISKSLIAPGHAAVKKTISKLEREMKFHPSARKTSQDAINMIDTFPKSFTIEAAITKTKEDAIKHYRQDRPIEEIDLLIEQTDARYFELAEKRFALFNQRLAIIANTGK